MLGRRQIREKVTQAVYAYYQNPIKVDVLEQNMFSEIEKIYYLYIYQLNFIIALKEVAERQIENDRNRYIIAEKHINPNRKFVDNQVINKLEENVERLQFTSLHTELKWDIDNEFLRKTYQKIITGKRYNDYMNSDDYSFDGAQKFIAKLFLKYVAENESFHQYVEDKELFWADDIHISNTMVQKTIGMLKEEESSDRLIRVIKNEEDRSFASKLLRDSLKNIESTEEKIKERLENWDISRVSTMDKVILVLAITELDNFPFTPLKIIVNEYIEIAKTFSTNKSNIFVNGVLDKYSRDINRT
jgi:transcription antitermination factor nusB